MPQVLGRTSTLFWAPGKAWVRQPILILSPFVWGRPRMQGLHRSSALFCAPEKTKVRQPILILSPFVWGSLGFQVLRSTSALFWAPEKAGLRQPILILSPFLCGSVALCLGIPEDARVTQHFRPLLGPRKDTGESSNSDFVPLSSRMSAPLFGDPRGRKGYIALPPSFGPPKRHG